MAWKDTERERWSSELACCVRRITYDFERGRAGSTCRL